MHLDQILLPSDLGAFGFLLEYKLHSRFFYISWYSGIFCSTNIQHSEPQVSIRIRGEGSWQ